MAILIDRRLRVLALEVLYLGTAMFTSQIIIYRGSQYTKDNLLSRIEREFPLPFLSL